MVSEVNMTANNNNSSNFPTQSRLRPLDINSANLDQSWKVFSQQFKIFYVPVIWKMKVINGKSRYF